MPNVSLGAAYAKLLVDSNAMRKGMGQTEREFNRGLDRMERSATQRMASLSQKFSSAGRALLPLSIAAAGVFAAGIKSASDFQSKLVEIEARSGATADQIAKLDETITQQAANTVFNAKQIGDAYLFALTSGQSLTEALGNMPEVLDLAAAGGMDVSRAMDIATNILAQFNETVEATPEIVDVLNAAAGASPATIGEMGDAFTNAGSVAKLFGLNIRDTGEVLATFARSGIRGAEAGTLLRSMLNFMTRDTAATTGGWKKLGVELFDVDGKMRDLDPIFSEVAEAMADMSEQERIMISRDIAGRFGIQGFNALVTAKGVGAMRDAMTEVAKASDVAAARMDTFDRQVASLQGSLDALLKTAFTPIMEDVLTPMVKRLIVIVNSVREWASENEDLVKVIVALIGGVAVLAPLLLAIGGAMSMMATLMPLLAVGFSLLTGPLGLAAIAITALVVALSTDFMGLRSRFGGVVSTIRRHLRLLVASFREVIAQVTGFIGHVKQQLTNEAGAIDLTNLLAIDLQAAWTTGLEAGEKLRKGVVEGLGLDDGSEELETELEVDLKVNQPPDGEVKSKVDEAERVAVAKAQAIAHANELEEENKINVPIKVDPDVSVGTWTPESGDTLWALWESSETGLTWDQFKKIIQEANPSLKLDHIVTGVPVRVPFAVSPEVFTDKTSTHVVKEGETELIAIWNALKGNKDIGWGAFADFVQAANPGMDLTNLRVGQHVRVPFFVSPEVSTPPQGMLSDVHLVKEGDSLVSIWDKIRKGTGVTLKEFVAYVQEANQGVDLSNLEAGTILRIPFQAVPEVTSGVSEYLVKPDDTLSGIWAKLKGDSEITLAEFLAWVKETNNLQDVNRIQVGQTLRLPFGVAPELSSAEGFVDHLIKPGDSLRSLWQAVNSVTGITWEAFNAYLKAANPGFDLSTLGTARNIRIPMSASPELSAAVGLAEHVVKDGDDLRAVWDALKGETGLSWDQFMDMIKVFNPGMDFGNLREGQVVRMPVGVRPDVSFQDDADWAIDYVTLLTPAINTADVESAGATLGAALGAKVGEVLRSAIRQIGDLSRFLLGGERLDVTLDEYGKIDAVGIVMQEGIIDALADSIFGSDLTGQLTIVDRAQEWLGDLLANVLDFGESFTSVIAPQAAELATTVRTLVEAVFARVDENFSDFPAWLQDNVITPVSDHVRPAVESGLANLARFLFGDEESGEGNLLQRLQPVAVEIGSSLLTLVQGILSGAGAAFANITAWVAQNVIAPVSSAVGSAIATGLETLDRFLFGDEEAGTGNVLQRLAPVSTSISDSLRTLVEGVLADAGASFSDFATWARDNVLVPIVDAVRPGLEQALASLGTFLFGDEEAGTGNILERLSPMSQEIGGSIREFVEGLLEDAPEHFSDFSAWFDSNVIAPLKAKIPSAIQSGLDSLIDTLLGEEQTVTQGSTQFTTRGPNLLARIGAGLAAAIADPGQALSDAFAGLSVSLDLAAIGEWIDTNISTPVRAWWDENVAPLLEGGLLGEQLDPGLHGGQTVYGSGILQRLGQSIADLFEGAVPMPGDPDLDLSGVTTWLEDNVVTPVGTQTETVLTRITEDLALRMKDYVSGSPERQEELRESGRKMGQDAFSLIAEGLEQGQQEGGFLSNMQVVGFDEMGNLVEAGPDTPFLDAFAESARCTASRRGCETARVCRGVRRKIPGCN